MTSIIGLADTEQDDDVIREPVATGGYRCMTAWKAIHLPAAEGADDSSSSRPSNPTQGRGNASWKLLERLLKEAMDEHALPPRLSRLSEEEQWRG